MSTLGREYRKKCGKLVEKLIPDLIKAEGYGTLSEKGKRGFNYYTSEKPNERQYSYYEIKNGQITFTGILEKNKKIQK